MFTYALYRKFELMGVEACVDLSFYDGIVSTKYVLEDVFPSINPKRDTEHDCPRLRNAYASRNIIEKIVQKVNAQKKSVWYERNPIEFTKKVFRAKDCCMEGFWQSDKYWLDVKNDIISDFTFADINDDGINKLLDFINGNSVCSVHVRGGDYLDAENKAMFGGICTPNYYKKAMEYITSIDKNVKFLVFTNDKEYCSSFLSAYDTVEASDYLVGLPDWVDMMLMSKCKYNITANSTFSWWGAYLNQTPDAVVIAPDTWINGNGAQDIWPKDWIRIEGN